jgi:signal transduction histidine kinase
LNALCNARQKRAAIKVAIEVTIQATIKAVIKAVIDGQASRKGSAIERQTTRARVDGIGATISALLSHLIFCARTMKLITKGLVLLAIPTLFELGLLGALADAQRQAVDAERWSLHSKEVLTEANRVLDPVFSNAVRLAEVAIESAEVVPQRLHWEDVTPQIDRLAALVADNPQQTQRVEALRQAELAYRAWYDVTVEQLEQGQREVAVTRLSGADSEHLLDSFRAALAVFEAQEVLLDASRAERADVVHQRQQLMLWLAGGGAIVTGAIAVVLFSRSVRRRLIALTEHAGNLTGDRPLGAPVRGDDELALLDAALFSTAQRLARAEATQAQTRAALQQRAWELSEVNDSLRSQTRENEMFVYSVSHDLRSPLVNLQGFSRELTRACADLHGSLVDSRLSVAERATLDRLVNQDINGSLHFLQTAVSRAANIIDALLRLSRAGRVELRIQRVEVGDLVRTVIDAMQVSIRERGASVTVQRPMPAAWGDPTAIEQVFGNLIGNALAYLDPQRSGVIEVGCGPDPRGVHPGQVYYVKDNGLGISAAALPRMFKAFTRLHGGVAPGEGVGLALVRRVVERHGGQVWVESIESVGSTFYIWLPAPQAPLA